MILDLDASLNKSHVALAIGKSQQAVSKLSAKIDDATIRTNGQLLEAIVSRLTEEAAGRGGDSQDVLVQARIRDLHASAEVKELTAKEKSGELVNVTEIEPQLVAMVTAVRQELLMMPDKMATNIKALHGVDVDVSLIQEMINDALKHLATRLHGDDASDDVASDEGVVTAS